MRERRERREREGRGEGEKWMDGWIGWREGAVCLGLIDVVNGLSAFLFSSLSLRARRAGEAVVSGWLSVCESLALAARRSLLAV